MGKHKEHVSSMSEALVETRQNEEALSKALEKHQDHSQKTYATQVALDDHVNNLSASIKKASKQLQDNINNLESLAATKAALQDVFDRLQANNDQLNSLLVATQSDLK